ncbi:MAG: hypothetical protein ABFS21_07980 [Actinomycetota bacterium]
MTVLLAVFGLALPDGGAEAVVSLLVAAVIAGLYFVIRRTRIKSRDHYLDRAQREEEQRRNDPDMKQ